MSKKYLFFILVLIFCSTYFLNVSQSKVTNLGNQHNIKILNQSYIDNYIKFDFKELDDKIWFANFTMNQSLINDVNFCNNLGNTCYKSLCYKWFSDLDCDIKTGKLRTDLNNMGNYPLQNLTKNIAFSKYSYSDGKGSFYINLPNGFMMNEYAELGFGSTYIFVTETRYFDVIVWTVNGLLTSKLQTSYTQGQIASVQAYPLNTSLLIGYWGIRVWKRSNTSIETEITSGTPVAQYSTNIVGWHYGSGTWSCPQTSLNLTDSIVIRTYNKIGTNSWAQTYPPTNAHGTEQLGAIWLNASTWIVRYNVRITQAGIPPVYQYLWYYDIYTSEDLIDEIDNFAYSLPTTTSTTTTTTSTSTSTTSTSTSSTTTTSTTSTSTTTTSTTTTSTSTTSTSTSTSTTSTSTTSTSTTTTIPIPTTITQFPFIIKEPLTPSDYINEYVFNPVLDFLNPDRLHFSTKFEDCMLSLKIYNEYVLTINSTLEDTYVFENDANGNFKTNPELSISGNPTWRDWVFIKFDNSPIPRNANIIYVKLGLYVYAHANPSYRGVAVWDLPNQTWLQNYPTWNNRFALGFNTTNNMAYNSTNFIDDWKFFNVIIDLNHYNTSFMLNDTTNDLNREDYYSKECITCDISYRPKLEVKYNIVGEENYLAEAMMCDLIEQYQCIKEFNYENKKLILWLC